MTYYNSDVQMQKQWILCFSLLFVYQCITCHRATCAIHYTRQRQSCSSTAVTDLSLNKQGVPVVFSFSMSKHLMNALREAAVGGQISICELVRIGTQDNEDRVQTHQSGLSTARHVARLQSTGSYWIGGRSGRSLSGVKREATGTTIRVASSRLEGQTFQLKRTPSRSSFC